MVITGLEPVIHAMTLPQHRGGSAAETEWHGSSGQARR
jgi:hypothetical protein